MSDASATRSAVIEMKDERRAMHEGYVFLDEKCLLLAGEILRQLEQLGRLQRRLQALERAARNALMSAVARHGLQGLQLLPPAEPAGAGVHRRSRSLMGVPLQEASWSAGTLHVAPSVQDSPEARAGRQAFADWLAATVEAAAVHGNLERLSAEYRRSVRRARALQDVMLPELDHDIGEIEGRLEELEQEDAIWMRQGAGRSGPGAI